MTTFIDKHFKPILIFLLVLFIFTYALLNRFYVLKINNNSVLIIDRITKKVTYQHRTDNSPNSIQYKIEIDGVEY